MNEMRLWRVESTILREAYNNVFTINPWYYKLKEKEVRKKMAIDYREEWEKFRVYYGQRGVALKIDEVKGGVPTNLGTLMDDWINDTIEIREKLMQEFVKQRMTTNITKQDKRCYYVDIVINDGIFGRFAVSRNEFRTWLKNKKKGGK